MTDDQIKALVKTEVEAALRAQKLEVVTIHHGDGTKSTYTRYPYPRVYGLYPAMGYHETVQQTSVTELIDKILSALEMLGVEVYHKPAISAEWGLRKKPPQESSDTSTSNATISNTGDTHGHE